MGARLVRLRFSTRIKRVNVCICQSGSSVKTLLECKKSKEIEVHFTVRPGVCHCMIFCLYTAEVRLVEGDDQSTSS